MMGPASLALRKEGQFKCKTSPSSEQVVIGWEVTDNIGRNVVHTIQRTEDGVTRTEAGYITTSSIVVFLAETLDQIRVKCRTLGGFPVKKSKTVQIICKYKS